MSSGNTTPRYVMWRDERTGSVRRGEVLQEIDLGVSSSKRKFLRLAPVNPLAGYRRIEAPVELVATNLTTPVTPPIPQSASVSTGTKEFYARKTSRKKAELVIYDDIGESWFFEGVTAKGVRKELNALGDVDQLDVRVNSYGGDVYEGYAIFNTIREFDAEVTTYVDGIAASAASLIALAGETRIAYPLSTYMIHEARSFAMGTAGDFEAAAARLRTLNTQIIEQYVRSADLDQSTVEGYLSADGGDGTYFTGEEAVNLGFLTELRESSDDSLPMAASISMLNSLPKKAWMSAAQRASMRSHQMSAIHRWQQQTRPSSRSSSS